MLSVDGAFRRPRGDDSTDEPFTQIKMKKKTKESENWFMAQQCDVKKSKLKVYLYLGLYYLVL